MSPFSSVNWNLPSVHEKLRTTASRAPLLSVLLCVCVVVQDTCVCVHAYNIDIRTAVVHQGPRGSMFGYSVAMHREDQQNWLLVGAPRAQTSQRQVEQGGAVYRCPPTAAPPPPTPGPARARIPQRCNQIVFDRRGPNIQYDPATGRYLHSESKSHQWFGATVQGSTVGSLAMACAPLFVWYGDQLTRRQPIGACYVTNTSSTYASTQQYTPCRTGTWGHHRQGSCQAGFSAHLTADRRHLMMGAVGSWYWQGQLYSQTLSDYDEPDSSTPEMSEEHDNSYMGYSMSQGDLDGQHGEDYVVGAPRANNLTGMVYLYTWDLVKLATLHGKQMGEYFGYSVTVGDWNGDGSDDIAVGAPFYSDYTSDAYDQGRVYVHYQHTLRGFSAYTSSHLSGSLRGGCRFGAAVANLRDINMDGYHDLAVGAPYSGTEGMGAVYIFHGSKIGLQSKYKQVILPEDIHMSLRAFGFSLKGGLDMDGNQYPDLLIGSFKSDNAVLLRTRPVVHVYTELSVTPLHINLDRRVCTLPDGTIVACFSFETCVSYEGVDVPQQMGLEMSWRVDTLPPVTTRAFFLKRRERVTLQQTVLYIQKYSQICERSHVYMENNIRNKLTPIQIDLHYTLVDPPHPGHNELLPILDQSKNHTDYTQAHILKNCGTDHVCIPDLRLIAYRNTPTHVLGTHDPLEVIIEVSNSGEDGFEAQVTVVLPEQVDYINVRHIRGQMLSCVLSEATKASPEIVVCDVGNPLSAGDKVEFGLIVSPTNINASVAAMEFSIFVNSSNPENSTDLHNNEIFVEIPYVVENEIRITGVSKPEQVTFNSTIVEDGTLGPDVIHLYEIRNLGPSSISSASITIHWPSYFPGSHATDYPLLYITSQPLVLSDQGQGYCHATNANPWNLTMDFEIPQISISEDMMLRLRRDELVNSDPKSTDKSNATTFNSDELGADEGYSRTRRSIEEDGDWNSTTQKRDLTAQKRRGSITVIDCQEDAFWCTSIHCNTGLLHSGESMLVQIHAKLVQNSVVKKKKNILKVRSSASCKIQDVPYAVLPEVHATDKTQVSTFLLAIDRDPPPQRIAIWVLALAITAGTILLFLIILMLWSCGFFKRKPPRELTEIEKMKEQNNKVKTKSNVYEYDTIPNDDAL